MVQDQALKVLVVRAVAVLLLLGLQEQRVQPIQAVAVEVTVQLVVAALAVPVWSS